MSLEMALSGHAPRTRRCLLLGVNRLAAPALALDFNWIDFGRNIISYPRERGGCQQIETVCGWVAFVYFLITVEPTD
jgi:hypothetical protein